ncbi:MAG: hypothetical protein KF709_09540 [Gemmatimonadaceae bacterium]|nr:hypothetical protein [Gemmatimonadaceae bacterium]
MAMAAAGSAIVAPDARWAPLHHVRAWRVMRSGPADGPTNMATDAALLDLARETGIATLRTYSWDAPTLSFGRHERTRGRFSPGRLDTAGVAAVRRPTGGRALLHHRELTYSVAAPAGDAPLRARYEAVNQLLSLALQQLRVEVTRVERRSLTRPDAAACFAEPNVGELVVDGRKLVASAQVEAPGAFLQHGSILLDDDQARIADLSDAPGTLQTHATSLRTLLEADVTFADVAAALEASLQRLTAADVAAGLVTFEPLAQSIPQESERLATHRAHFADPAWTWSR